MQRGAHRPQGGHDAAARSVDFHRRPRHDHPADRVAAEDVEHDVGVEVRPLHRPQQLGDVPGVNRNRQCLKVVDRFRFRSW